MVIKRLWHSWLILAKNNLQSQLMTRSSAYLFIAGKILNFIFTLILVFAVFSTTSLIKGYTLSQAIIFAMVYNITDSLSGFLFRAIYSFRPILVKGDFDLDLLKPLPSFFRPLLSAPDFLDFPPIVIQIGILTYYLVRLGIHLSFTQIFGFVLLLICAMVVTFSIYLAVAAFSILSTEVDNLMSIIRSVSRAGIMPIDIYSGAFRFLITYIIPLSLIITIPAQTLLGLVSFPKVILTIVLSGITLLISLTLWKMSLRSYTSASS